MKKPIKPLEELLDSVRDIEGFPIGKDEDILALSDPPYYTACPNPYINDFIEEYGTPYDEETDDYHREPFVGDVSEGKNNPIYNAHSYHTKVPHKAIMKYIEHYTEKGDIVLDGFCGTGMTGVASQLLNRKAILFDISPIASFIAYNFNNPIKTSELEQKAEVILEEIRSECEWLYETNHIEAINNLQNQHTKLKKNSDELLIKGKINFIVYSDVFVCPYCNKKYVFWNEAIDNINGKILTQYNCSNCLASITKRDSNREMIKYFDNIIQQEVTQAKQVPVIINYSVNYPNKNKRYEKKPDYNDFQLLSKINNQQIPYWFPINKLPEGVKTQDPKYLGITHIHHFYTKSNLWVMSAYWEKVKAIDNNRIAYALMLGHSAANPTLSKMRRFRADRKGGGALPGTLYIASLTTPPNVILSLARNIKFLLKGIKEIEKIRSNAILSTSSITNSMLPENSVDYIFTDPPFGDNLMYSELNFLWESWLKVFTNNSSEVIINKAQKKELAEYHNLMTLCFTEYFRVLKPNRWITVIFHNSKSSIWNSIQTAMAKVGFVIAQVTVLNKMQGSFNQVSASGAVKNDLVISAYKPNQLFLNNFVENGGEGLEKEFVKMHLSHLKPEPSVERTEQMLYSKLLAYYVQRGYTVKYDANTFYKMLRQKFTEEDGYWFNKEQISNYREFKRKMKLDEIKEVNTGQLLLFVSDEKSAIIWLHAFLNEPKDFQTIHPAYTKLSNISGDNVPDLKELLDKNFTLEKGKYRRPQTDDEKLSLTQKRERELQREFDELLLEARGSKKKIKECRKQAVIYGFEQCYKNNRFQDIAALGKRLHKKIIENDSEISEFIEVAGLKVNGF